MNNELNMQKTKVDQLKDMMKAKKEAEEKKDQMQQTAEQKPESDEMSLQIKAAEDEAKAHYDKFLRVMAEFENFKKRMDRERQEHAKYANQSLLHDLLPVMDDFDRVLSHIPKETITEVAAIADGVKITRDHFINALSRYGLTPLESAIGKPFDPTIHEAVTHIETNEHSEGTVTAEHRKGWKLYDRIIRAAMVSVAKGKGEA